MKKTNDINALDEQFKIECKVIDLNYGFVPAFGNSGAVGLPFQPCRKASAHYVDCFSALGCMLRRFPVH